MLQAHALGLSEQRWKFSFMAIHIQNRIDVTLHVIVQPLAQHAFLAEIRDFRCAFGDARALFRANALKDGLSGLFCSGLLDLIRVIFQRANRFLHISMSHQTQTQTIARIVELLEMARTEALLIDLDSLVGLHDRFTEEIIDVCTLHLGLKQAQRTFAILLIDLPDGRRIDMLSQTTHLPPSILTEFNPKGNEKAKKTLRLRRKIRLFS